MATRSVQVTDGYELFALLRHKVDMMKLCFDNCPDIQRLPLIDLGKEVVRMGEIVPALKEAVAALPKPLQLAEGSKRAS